LRVRAVRCFAQTGPPGTPSFETRVAEMVKAIAANEPGLKRFPSARRTALVEFVIGNTLFVSTHERDYGDKLKASRPQSKKKKRS
jgi:hypothetical protein